MRRIRKSLLLLTFCLAALTVLPPAASAGEYSVKQCAGSAFTDQFGWYNRMGQDYVDVIDGCGAPVPGRAQRSIS